MPGIEIKGRSKIATYRHGGRISKQLGGVGNTQPITGTRRFDQSRGYYQPDMGMRGGAMYNKGGRVGLKKGGNGKWIQKAVKGMRKDKPCTGDKFGSASCPPGSKRYNLAKTFKKMAKKRKAA